MAAPAVTERSTGQGPVIRAPAFTGRDRELAAVAEALAGGPAVVLVEGEAGIGKSRLLREYLASAEGGEGTVLVACCPPLARPQTLGPVAEAVRQAAAGTVARLRLSPLGGALRPLFPEWSADLPPALEQAEDASAARYRVFAALAGLLERLDAGLLAVEDAHWADEATLEFLLYLASRQPRPVSLVVTCRPEEMPAGSLLPRLARLAAGTSGWRLALGPLDATATAGLVSSMLAGERLSGEFAGFLHEHTGGVPLAVEESVRLMAARADLVRRDGRWVRREVAGIAVPPPVRDAALERAGRLGRDAQAVLRAAAVLGEPAPEATITAATGISAGRAWAGLCEALACGLLAEDTRGLVSFHHMLVGRAVYEAIPPPECRAMHSRAGQALEDVAQIPASRLARHFREAGDTGRWCRYGERAADLARASGDETTAAVLLHDLVTAAGLPPGEVARLAGKIVLLALPDSQLRDLASALRAVIDTGSLPPREEAGLRFQLGRLLSTMDEADASRAELERAVAGLPPGSLQATRAMMLLGWPTGSNCTAAEHLRWLRRAADTDASVPPAERLRLLVDRTTALLLLGDQRGWAETSRIPWDASTPRDRLQIARGQGNIGAAAMVWGRFAEARRRLQHAVGLASGYHYPRLRDAGLAALAHLDWLTGAWAGLAERAGALAGDEDADAMVRLEAVLITGLLRAAAGAREQAIGDLQRAVDETRRHNAVEYTMEPSAALARLHLADGGVADAVKVTDEPMSIVARKGIWIWATDLAPARAEALAACGQVDEAADLVAAFVRGLRDLTAPAPKAGLVVCQGIVADARGGHARAAGLFARAAEAWDALPRPYDALLARERQARCLLVTGSTAAGVRLLADTRQGLSDLGIVHDADRVGRALREHGTAAPRPRRGGRRGYGSQLSPRETEVVKLVAAGYTNPEIAAALSRSTNTIAMQRKSAMRKLGVSSRPDLVAKAAELGLAPDGHLDDAPVVDSTPRGTGTAYTRPGP
jgi:DNA-binding CsgD family transcriptional regulator/tetratricopeptide (TPR) repeat protein